MTEDFIVRRWFGVSTSKESGSVRSSVAIGRLLTIASTSIMSPQGLIIQLACMVLK